MKSNTAGFEKKAAGFEKKAAGFFLKHRRLFYTISSSNCHGVTALDPNAALLTELYIHQAGAGLLLQFQTPPCLLHHTFIKRVQRLTASIPNTALLTASYIHQTGAGLLLQFQTSTCLLHIHSSSGYRPNASILKHRLFVASKL
ncbi:hypothetical protein [Bacteroides pyogenes]|uniref:hypothetical protein n=1 Tax=Bacteroides pyogenes TaxID=310300 RepID=UPI002A917F0F|nr:hypothetical protein [Bacteroides pyogenes]MDY5432657.1 hypothetical protein [Bacteroides pyogenes]